MQERKLSITYEESIAYHGLLSKNFHEVRKLRLLRSSVHMFGVKVWHEVSEDKVVPIPQPTDNGDIRETAKKQGKSLNAQNFFSTLVSELTWSHYGWPP